MMNEKWEEQFREQIHDFVETIGKFDKGEIDRKAYKGISGGFGSYAQRDPSKHMLRLRMAGGKAPGMPYRGGKGLRCGAHEAYDL